MYDLGQTYVAIRSRIGDLFSSTGHFPSISFFCLNKRRSLTEELEGGASFYTRLSHPVRVSPRRAGTVPISPWSALSTAVLPPRRWLTHHSNTDSDSLFHVSVGNCQIVKLSQLSTSPSFNVNLKS